MIVHKNTRLHRISYYREMRRAGISFEDYDIFADACRIRNIKNGRKMRYSDTLVSEDVIKLTEKTSYSKFTQRLQRIAKRKRIRSIRKRG